MKFFLFSVVTTFALSLNAQPVKDHGRLHVEKTQLKDEHGNDVVLRGMSFGWHNWWPQFYNAGAVKTLHQDWGATIVRAAMGVEPGGAYIDRPDFAKQKIEEVVNAAIDEGIYVIVDWHSHHIRQTEAITFFKEMAEKYRRYPNIIYEIFNEPEYDSWAQVKDYSIAVVAAIRAIDKNNVILVGSPHWDQDVDLAANDPIAGFGNLMYTLHYYAATHKQGLRSKAEYALKKGLPIFISESAGMEASGDGPIDKTSWQQWIDWSEKNKISWITWSVSDKNETCSVLKPDAPSNGGWTETNLKESGIMSRNYLRKYAGLDEK